jgi:peptidoglycan/xylan/chitin deacetylase (PgdA/CDA1 family)
VIKAVMYHYVREYDQNVPYFRYLDIGDFRKQLTYFEDKFGFVTRLEWEDFVAFGKMPLEDGKVLLTFDDAMSCHYEYVFPELMNRGLWGLFYVPSQSYLESKMLDVHRIHLLCGRYKGEDLLTCILDLINPKMIPYNKIKEFNAKPYLHQDNYNGVSEFKRVLNYFVHPEYQCDLVDQVTSSFPINGGDDQFYVNPSSLLDMSKNGMVIGAHSHTHNVMSKLNYEEQKLDIHKSLEFVAKFNTGHGVSYCHPYGGFHSFDQNTLKVLNELNVDYSFNVEPRDIVKKDHIDSKHSLPRYDCNSFPYGTAS